jgi:hypothetical protein
MRERTWRSGGASVERAYERGRYDARYNRSACQSSPPYAAVEKANAWERGFREERETMEREKVAR